MGGYERSQLDRLASPFGHGTKHKLANEPGYQSCDLCGDELRTRVALCAFLERRRDGILFRRQPTQSCSGARLCGLWVKIKHATKSSTYRTEMYIAGGK